MDTRLKETVSAAAKGDREAFEKLYSAYRDRLFFFARKYTGSREAAEDVVSDTFITAMEKLSALRDGEAFGGWLYSIAYNKCMDRCREDSERLSLDSENVDAVIKSPVMLPDDYAVSTELKCGLRDIIDGLSPDARSAVIMYYYEEMSVEEVAKAMSISENAAKQKLFRARRTMRTKIEELVGKGGVFAAVPLGAVLNNTAELGEETVSAPGAAVSGSGAARLAGTGFAAKAAAIGAAAVMAVGIPVALGKLSNGGDHRAEDSSAIERTADDSRTDSRSDSRDEDIIVSDREETAFVLLGHMRAELDHDETRRMIEELTPAESISELTFREDGSDWHISCSGDGQDREEYVRVPSDKGWYIVDGKFNVYHDSEELGEYVINAVTEQCGGSQAETVGFSVDCDEPFTEAEYVDAAVKCCDAWLTQTEKDNGLQTASHRIAMVGSSGSNVTNYLASGMVNGEKQFLAEVCFEGDYPTDNDPMRHFWQDGRYTAAGAYWSGYYICGRFTFKDGRVTLDETGTRDDVDRMKQGLNGIISGGYKNFYEFARRPDLTEAIEDSFVPYGRVTASRNLTQTMDGTAINVDIYSKTIDSEDEDSYTAIWYQRAYIDRQATYSTGLYFTDGGTGHVPDTLPKDFRLTFDNYDGDGNPDFCCRYDADENGTYYFIDSIQSDGRIFNYSGRAYEGGIYIAGCTDPSPRLQKTDDHRYIGWKTEGGRYYPTDESGSEIQLPEINMYSDRYYLPNDLKLYSKDENSVTCFVWNNTQAPITTDGSYAIERFDGRDWVTEAEGLSASAVTVAPREWAEITYDISALKERYYTTYRIVQKSGQLTGCGSFCCEGAAVAAVTVEPQPVRAGAHTGSFTVTDNGVEQTNITSASVNVDGREVPLIVDVYESGRFDIAGALPEKPGSYTLTVNGSFTAELVVTEPEDGAFTIDIDAEYNDNVLTLTVTPTVDCTVDEAYGCKRGSEVPVIFDSSPSYISHSKPGDVPAGETRSITMINAYSTLYRDDDRLAELYRLYSSGAGESLQRYGIEPGLSEEEFKARMTGLMTLNADDDYILVIYITVGEEKYLRLIS